MVAVIKPPLISKYPMINHPFLILLSFLFATLLSACGGGGGGGSSSTATPSSPTPAVASAGTISAADGSAMSYAQITIVSLADGASAGYTADANGKLQIPTAFAYPAIVQAQSLDGTKINYGYIANNTQTSVPVNPLSTLVLTIAAGKSPGLINSNFRVTDTSVASAKAAVNSIFANIFSQFSVASNVDLLTTSFETNHSGIDLILDSMSVIFDNSGNPTVCTKVLNTCKVLTLSNLDTTPLAISSANVNLIKSVPVIACSNFITNLGASSFATFNANLYDANFLNSGLGAQSYNSNFYSKLNGINASFNTPLFVGQDVNNNYIFQFYVFNNTSNQYAGTQSMAFKLNSAGNCVMAGDQLPFWIQVNSQITYNTRINGLMGGLSTPAADSGAITAAPVAGIYFKAGGDSFGNSAALDNVTVNGNNFTIQTLKFYLCDASNSCNTPLITMTKGGNNNGYYYTPNNLNTLPIVSYSSLGISSAATFYNGNPNPIKVDMLDSNGINRGTTYLKIKGSYISPSELQAITLPSVSNAADILNTQRDLVNPTLNLSTPAGTIVQAVSLTSGPNNGTPTTSSVFVLSSSSTSTVISKTISAGNDSYRSIQLNGSTSTGKPIAIKYVFSTASGSI